MLKTSEFSRLREEKGKLRTFFLVSLRNFMVNEWRHRAAEKRGGNVQMILSIDVDAADCRNPVSGRQR